MQRVELAGADLMAARAAGFRAVAIVLVHGWRFTDHERRLATIAREVGERRPVAGSVPPQSESSTQNTRCTSGETATHASRASVEQMPAVAKPRAFASA